MKRTEVGEAARPFTVTGRLRSSSGVLISLRRRREIMLDDNKCSDWDPRCFSRLSWWGARRGSDDALSAAWTATVGLHSSSSTSATYSYLAFGPALRSWSARTNELRPPRPFDAVPPVNGPMKASLTVFFWARAALGPTARRSPSADVPWRSSRGWGGRES